MTLEQLRTWVTDKMVKYPDLRSDIRGLYRLCLDEIEDGGSVEHEIELCINDIEELIDENTNND